MARFTFAVSALLTTVGVVAALAGIAANEFKPVAVGFVLLAGGAVFALLYVGTRRGTLVSPPPAEEPWSASGSGHAAH